MHEQTAKRLRLHRQYARGLGVHGEGSRLVRLGIVDCGIGGGVHDHVRTHRAHKRAQRIGIG
ncbi:hypothetical protein D3C87_1391650 [compost metagenome]